MSAPLPWDIYELGQLPTVTPAVIDANKFIVAQCESIRDARLIVTAVNAHADLLAAARTACEAKDGILRIIEKAQINHEAWKEAGAFTSGLALGALSRLQDALSKAEEAAT